MSARLLAVALLLLNTLPAAGAELGRMFFTPAQREVLDAARVKNLRSEISNENPQPPPAAPVPQNMSLNGMVKRSDGASTVWLNGQPVTTRQAAGLGITPGRNDSRVRLTAPDKSRSVELKVGQTAEILSGTVQETYTRRAIPNPAPKSAEKAPPGGAAEGSPGEKTLPSPSGQPLPPTESVLSGEARSKESSTRPPAQ